MTDHNHTWAPLAGHVALYTCTCGTVGKRNLRRGIVEALKSKRVRPAETAGFSRAVSTQKANAFEEELYQGRADFGACY